MQKTIVIGYDSPHPGAFAVARHSMRRRMTYAIPIIGLELGAMQRQKLYTRAVDRTLDGKLWDPISEAPMATEFAISRFLAPFLANWGGWVVFTDCDVLATTDMGRLFDLLDDRFALMCVHLDFRTEGGVKMDGQAQLAEIDPRAAGRYTRKCWSSVMAFNCEHQANRALTLQLINSVPGRDLHRFCWLPDSAIGALPAEWNWIEGVTDPQISPALIHYTHGGPWLENCQGVAHAAEWRREQELWISGDMR